MFLFSDYVLYRQLSIRGIFWAIDHLMSVICRKIIPLSVLSCMWNIAYVRRTPHLLGLKVVRAKRAGTFVSYEDAKQDEPREWHVALCMPAVPGLRYSPINYPAGEEPDDHPGADSLNLPPGVYCSHKSIRDWSTVLVCCNEVCVVKPHFCAKELWSLTLAQTNCVC